MKSRWPILVAFLAIFVAVSCNLPFSLPSNQPTAPAQPTTEQKLTPLATEVQGTLGPATFPTFPPTFTPPPLLITQAPTTDPTKRIATGLAQSTVTVEVENKGKFSESRIVVLEDIKGNTKLLTRVDKALAGLGLTGPNVINYYDATGDFYKAIKSGKPWDLIIVAAENRTSYRLGIWDAVKAHADKNTAIIIENWYQNELIKSNIDPLFEKCGIRVEAKWTRHDGFDPLNYALLALEPEHPIFNTPNKVRMPMPVNAFWKGTVGDLLTTTQGSEAQILSGLRPSQPDRYGLVASCLDGRMIYQSFSTHDYPKDETIKLWQNYIVYTLNNHYKNNY
jgi:hypothetical protein